MPRHRADARPDGRRPIDPPSEDGAGPLPPRARRGRAANLGRRLTAVAVLVAVAAAGVVAVDLSGLPLLVSDAASSRAAASVGADRVAAAVALDRRERAVSRDATRVARAKDADQRLRVAAARAARERRAALATLAARAERRAEVIAAREAAKRARAWHLPVARGAYHLTSRFGECSSLWSSCHTGLDFAAPSGTPIRAVAAGKVLEVGYAGAYGNRTRIRLVDGTELWYCHQTSTAVSRGEQVAGGQVIGTVGSTGNSTGPHLHLEVRPNPKVPADPFAALSAHHLRP